MAWINSMMALVSSDELAKDVTGAEALLERHQVRLAQSDSFSFRSFVCNDEFKSFKIRSVEVYLSVSFLVR